MSFKLKYSFVIFIFSMILFTSENLSANNNENNNNSSADSNLEVEKIVLKLENHYDVPGFEADFYQVITLNHMGTTSVSHGKVSVLKPSSVKWKYTEPYSQTIIYNNGTIFIFDPTINQLIIANSNSFVGKGIGVSFILEMASIQKFFILSLEKEMQDLYQLKLTPKETYLDISEVYMFISKINYNLLQVKIITSCEDEIIIKLDNFDLNSVPNQKIFELDTSKEVDILRLDDCNLFG